MKKTEKEFVDRLFASLKKDPISKYGIHIVGDPGLVVVYCKPGDKWKRKIDGFALRMETL